MIPCIRPYCLVLSFALVALGGVTATVATVAAVSPVGWAWVGGVTEAGAVVTARLHTEEVAGLRIGDSTTTLAPVLTAPMDNGVLHRFAVTGLDADAVYRYRFVGAEGNALDDEERSFRTFPTPGKPASFRFVVSSCARGMNSPVFAAAMRQDARFFLHTGDFHYYDIAKNQVEIFRTAYNSHLSAPRLRAMLARMPMLYQWDDHDFGPNDSDRSSPSREAALLNFRQLVPHHPLTVGTGPLAPTDQAFTVGRVRFILSDLRSERDADARRTMSAAQDAWLRAQLLEARDAGAPLIFWVSSVPWNGEPNTSDRWQGYAGHRAEIADFIKDNGLAGRVAILSGDAHMTAIDDGAHSDFATGGGAPIRVFQAGPIANRGSYKAGPYSHGARSLSGYDEMLNYFGLVEVTDDGREVRVKWSGREGADGVGDEVLIAEREPHTPIELEFTAP